MNTKTLYRLYHVESDTISLCETNFSGLIDGYVLLNELHVDYSDGLSPMDTAKLEEKLDVMRNKLLARAQIIQEKLNTLHCIDYKPEHNAHAEGNEHDTGAAH